MTIESIHIEVASLAGQHDALTHSARLFPASPRHVVSVRRAARRLRPELTGERDRLIVQLEQWDAKMPVPFAETTDNRRDRMEWWLGHLDQLTACYRSLNAITAMLEPVVSA